MESGIPYEFRTTVVDEFHDEESFKAIGKMISGAGDYYLQEFVDRDTVPDKNLSSPGDEKLSKYLEIVKNYVPNAKLRGL